ncbi:sulfotransferase family 2 domain-containing protein [Caenimonas sedimenti]|nr:sulfotransferase family 2 domain-containing protein [Caenimonas sedimenti]
MSEAIAAGLNAAAPGAAQSVGDVDWLLDQERGFVMFFRPRCGSTTLTRWFFENLGVKFGGFSIAAYRNEWLEPRLEQLRADLHSRYAELHKFVVVRDPFERAVSSYLHVVNNPKDTQWEVVKPDVPQGLEKQEFTFRQWVDYLERIDLDATHIIWRRQSALSCWDRGVNDVVRLESMNDYLLEMNSRFGVATKPTFNSVTVPVKEKRHPRTWWWRPKFYGDTPFRELLQFKGKAAFQDFPDYSHFYDRGLRSRISRVYGADVEIFANANR